MSMQIRSWAPIALFIFNRPAHTQRVIESLQACKGFAESPVYVFADGPRRPEEAPIIRETRAVARSLLGDHAIFFERDSNLGVDSSVINGVTQLCGQYGKVVVVEDDLVVSTKFLEFLNMGLELYQDETRVMQIVGNMFDVPQLHEHRQAIFLPMTNSSGWATWKRAWDQFDPTATGWRQRLADDRERRRFDLDGHYKFRDMLSHQMRRRVPAWDIRWYYSVFARGGLVLYPPRTLVFNIGFDGTGTHDRFSLPVRQAQIDQSAAFDFPTRVEQSPETGHVFKIIGTFRSSSAPQKISAVTRAALNRVAGR